jgi:hypothetical protein
LKESNPVEVAQYAVSNKIDDEPAFACWVPFTLKKQESIISAVNKRYWKRTHKFGICLPHTVEEALQIDKENNNDPLGEIFAEGDGQCDTCFQDVRKGH